MSTQLIDLTKEPTDYEKAKVNPELLRQHILKFAKPAGTVPKAPHNMPLYHDVYTFFKERLQNQPAILGVHYITAEMLIDDLIERFEGKYNVEEVRKMLEIGHTWSKLYQAYEFQRGDFIKEVKP